MPEAGGDSFFQDIRRVPPAHLCIVTRESVEIRRHWHPTRKQLRLARPEDYQAAVRESVDRAVAARLRGSGGKVAAHLSGGLDSSTVAATAARLVGNEGRVTAFTAVPSKEQEFHVPRGRFGDEGPHAAAVAALYPQMEHVLVPSGGRSPTSTLDRNFFLFDRPVQNLCNGTWIDSIADGARDRGLKVLLTGQSGNMSFSYSGLEWLPELLAQGRLPTLARQLRGLLANGISIEGAIAHTVGPFLPAFVWRAINRFRGRHHGIADYSSVRPEAAERLRPQAELSGLDMSYRPRRDPIGARLWVLGRGDAGNYNKGALAGWGIDMRDPTADRRLVELCLSIPLEHFLSDGQPRALARRAFADRLPSAILEERRKGLQAIDWHLGLDVGRAEIADEVERFADLEQTTGAIDVAKLRGLLQDWPQGDWNQDRVNRLYRLALLRGVSAGHFVRKAAGSNA
ncbi:MAG TPA: asparagine synthase C-terminal domain-containing protein [Allosphingosinicella sp.]